MEAGDRVKDPAVGTARFQEVIGGERLERGAQLGRCGGRRPSVLGRQLQRDSLHRRNCRIFGRLEPGAEARNRRKGDEGLDRRQLAADLLDHLLDEEVAEIDAGEATLAIGNGIERRNARLIRRDMRALFRQERRDRRGGAKRQRHLDEDQRLIDQPRMEECVAAPVSGIDPPPQLVPIADFVHRLVTDDLFEKRSRRGPVDAAQHQKPPIEPRTEQMQKIAIDDGERRVLVHKLDEVGAHRNQGGRAAGRAIESPEELVTARLGGVVDFAQPSFVAVRAEVGDRRHDPVAIGSEIVGERTKESRMVRRIERAVAPEDLGRERDPRRFAPPGHQRPAVRDQLIDAVVRVLRPRLDLEHGAAAFGDRRQEIVEKSVAHDFRGYPWGPAIGRVHDSHTGPGANQDRNQNSEGAARRSAASKDRRH